MSLRIFTEPQQGASYDDLLAVAKKTEENGFDAFFRSDHFHKMGPISGLPGPSDAWTSLAGLARETSRIRLGTLVTSATFRHPAVLAVQVAQVDQMSGGRVEFGLGSGWFEQEHQAFGLPFPALGERFERFAEQLELITGMWATPAGETYNFDGKHYQLVDSPGLPKPAQSPRPPIIIGGAGKKKTPALAAKYADEFNVAFRDIDATTAQFDVVRDALVAAGRDKDALVLSYANTVAIGKDEATVARRAAATGREVSDLKANALCGSPAEIVDKLGAFVAAGVTRFYLQVLDLSDLDQLDLIASEIRPQI
ncbi:LLM class F420-dependent oxidoreductase [Fodinicola feengrottensis]|uniref:LLM class F420-dependent oxidoreductase n=1 Tax=Fodinicola feengrottensis TaxID=435914 RepID=UPI0013D084C6|nr:LLM class F420-dependent oxidoreductase [Fodinicola feengrottensis]